MLLINIPDYIKCKKIYKFNKKKLSFNFISTNSQDIKKSSIFAIVNYSEIKRKYLNEAISKGAIAILTNKYFSL